MSETGKFYFDLERVRKTCPLVHNITNFVVMNTTANALLAVGGSPIMAHAPQEMEDLVGIVGSLVLNIGTLSVPWIDSMLAAGRIAKERNIPIILDPVGAGASSLRTETSVRIVKEVCPTVVRGNASEIIALAGALKTSAPELLAEAGGATRGVDSARAGEGIEAVARDLARKHNTVVVVSGATDLICDADRVVRLTGGDALMPKVTGLGCTASALVGAFCAACGSGVGAAASAMAVMSTAGSMAAAKADGPGTLQLYFYDALYAMTQSDLDAAIVVENG